MSAETEMTEYGKGGSKGRKLDETAQCPHAIPTKRPSWTLAGGGPQTKLGPLAARIEGTLSSLQRHSRGHRGERLEEGSVQSLRKRTWGNTVNSVLGAVVGVALSAPTSP